ncbi:MAG: hypothetical protein R6V26_15500 [Roseovarius sp.]
MSEHDDTYDSETEKSERKTALLLIAGTIVFLAVWAGCVALFGIPGLYIPAVILVPVVYVLMVWGSFG